MFDSHIHTNFSTDSSMELEDAIRRASELGIGITATDHMDLKYPAEGKFIFDIDDYFDMYSAYHSESFLIGIELGLRNDCVMENRRISENHSFDYVLGSIHLVDGIDLYDASFYAGREKKDAYMRYLEYMLQCVKESDFIDSLAHIDYIARYARYDDREIYYDMFADCMDEVLNEIASKGKALEINTRRLDDAMAADNLMRIYKRFSQVGGKFVTIGSDAHNRNSIGSNFTEAMEIASLCDLKIVHFKERKMIVSEYLE